jgi:hypothetical protein
MEFVDELFAFYRDRLTGEEDAEIIVASVLYELDDEELFGLIGFYLVESLKERMAEEEIDDGEIPKFH